MQVTAKVPLGKKSAQSPQILKKEGLLGKGKAGGKKIEKARR